ncbi:MAG TPA: hypothetical protein PK074_00630 [Spirochaetales bacterium]|nr:hypothetical protein [Spirochaetales bacterium]HQK33206.1 hypothetical protein [Spirochaetales bacterium]
MSDIQNTHAEDEISLIDLIAVMLKYRWLIIGLTCASIVITTLAYFILPALKTSEISTNNATAAVLSPYETVTTLSFTPGIELLVQYSNLHYFTITTLSNPLTIDTALTAAHLDFGFLSRSPDERLATIRQELKKTKPADAVNSWSAELTFKDYKATVLNGIITLTIKSPDKEKNEKFIDATIRSLNETLKQYLIAPASALLTQGISTNQKNSFAELDAAKLNQQRSLANAIVNRSFNPVVKLMSYTLQEQKDIQQEIQQEIQQKIQIKNQIKKYGTIGTIGMLFLSIMLAFILQWINSIKNDPEAMQKITAALGKNKTQK